MERFLAVARGAAYEAGWFLRENLDGVHEVQYKGEGQHNPVSSIDRQAEDIIRTTVSQAFPGHGFLGEEKGGEGISSGYTWVIDPLDGTVNYLHRHPYFGVSIALFHGDEAVLGVVHNPVADEMFAASKGGGTHLNGQPVRVSRTAVLEQSLLAMSFPYERDSEAFASCSRYFISLARAGQALRRDGSTALSLCNVACGRYDGFCVAGNGLWDYAAGVLIVAEAGGLVTDFKGQALDARSNLGEVVATNGRIHQAVLDCCREG